MARFILDPPPVRALWEGQTVIVAAPGPSLTKEVARACRDQRVIAVQDAFKLLPFADIVYGCDAPWWDLHGDCKGFAGEKWSSHSLEPANDKSPQFLKFGLHVALGKMGDTFSTDPAFIHYGSNSGFQAVNLAGHLMGWSGRVVLVGYDMRVVNNKRHFFGDHPAGLNMASDYGEFIKAFQTAAKSLPAGFEIFNCTPGSALQCFPKAKLAEMISPQECLA